MSIPVDAPEQDWMIILIMAHEKMINSTTPTSCNATEYPQLYFQSLSPYARTSPIRLVEGALSVSLKGSKHGLQSVKSGSQYLQRSICDLCRGDVNGLWLWTSFDSLCGR
uniref:Uncharacterized protein n=1 Tax=Nelumbo nucifera TaxID=4432 RepID=A0A822ZYE6_NELNU|nr:TPA_asm: hypothetical protein HUJ06_017803 [Nelumbo nucifera]